MRAWQILNRDGESILNIEWQSSAASASESVPIQRICSVSTDYVLLLTCDNCLYEAILGNDTTLRLQLLRDQVQDVDYCSALKQLYVVTLEGIVLTRKVDVLGKGRFECKDWQTLSFDPLELSEDGIRIKRVCCSDHGVVFVTYSNEFYVIGNCGEIFSVDAAQPKHVKFYDESSIDEVMDIVAGEEFFALLIRTSYDEKLDPLGLNSIIVKHALKTTSTTLSSKQPIQSAPLYPPSTTHLMPELPAQQELNSNSSLHSYSDSSTKSSQLASQELESQFITYQILRHGYSLLHTQVHTFGSANNGLLGTSDHIKRGTINHISKLDAIGVCNIDAGREHTIVRTLDGRLLHWGLNTKEQLRIKHDTDDDLSSPSECDYVADVLAACCADYQTVILNSKGGLYEKRTKLELPSSLVSDHFEFDLPLSTTKREYPLLLSTGHFVIQNKVYEFRQQFQNSLIALRSQLRQLIKHSNAINMLQFFQRECNGIAQPLQQLQLVCLGYRRMLALIAAVLSSLEAFYRGDMESAADLLFLKHHRECIALFEAYTRVNCDVYSIDGYTEAGKLITSFSQSQSTVPTSVMATAKATATATATASATSALKCQQVINDQCDLAKVFQQPLNVVTVILQFLEQLSKTQHEYAEHLLAWQAYARKNTINLELAEHTLDFWQRNARNPKIRHFRRRHRRVILTSSAVPLKLSQHGISITSPTFILFSDCLCQLSGQLYTYPLVVMWLKHENDTSLRIITPEKSFVLAARSQHDKMLWYDQLESSILAALERPQGTKLSDLRTTSYVFSNSHPKYAGVHAYGHWRNGQLHGNCYLEYADGRFYYGEMRNGEIQGYGKMVIPTVGLYEGTFKAGKFHGHGNYELKDNEVYEGHFRDGLFHGHGLLRNNKYTYVGEFQANAKCGYGVLDDMLTGDKYMGMFADSKRIGAGICITMTGDYFEGVFASDELAGTGIAVFENDYYYEGELSMRGPNGKGTYYMPTGAEETEYNSVTQSDDDSNRMLIGNVIHGTQLGGNWQNVRVSSGTVAIDERFPKYPKTIGELVVDNKRKWRALFENFEEEIFGSSITVARTTTENSSNGIVHTHWNRIAAFLNTQREREKALEHDLHNESKHSYFGRNISLGFASSSSLSLKSSTFPESDSKCSTMSRLIKSSPSTHQSLVRSQSQETLYDSSLDLSLDLQQQQQSELHSDSFNSQLRNWASDTMNGYVFQNGHGHGHGQGHELSNSTAASSLRASYDSIFNLNTSFNNNNNSCLQDTLELIPTFGITTLEEDDVVAIKAYLDQAFKDRHHPLYILNQRIANCFYVSYGCWKVKPSPILTKHALHEWESLSRQIYRFVRKLFPALPEDFCVIESTREVISHITLLYPLVLTEGIYSTLFVLYANKYSRKDEIYRQNLIFAEKLPNDELALLIGLEFTLLEVVGTSQFAEAIQTLKQLQEKHSPKAMLNVIELCMQLITDAHKMVKNANTVILAADSMMPLTLFLVIRAAVPHLGAELALLDDLTGGANFQFEMNGIAGYCYTTLKAAYEHIIAKPLHRVTT